MSAFIRRASVRSHYGPEYGPLPDIEPGRCDPDLLADLVARFPWAREDPTIACAITLSARQQEMRGTLDRMAQGNAEVCGGTGDHEGQTIDSCDECDVGS